MTFGAITIDAATFNGKPVFTDTSVPVQAFFEYLEEGKSMERFLDDYPAVNKKDVIEVLQMAKSLITNERLLQQNFSAR